MIISIHQPNYLPWMGFFDKIARSDIFVIFDNVQFPRGKKHFGHRNLIKTDGEPKWLTVPLNGKSELKNFNEIEINHNGWNDNHLNLIKNFYRKSKYFNVYYPTGQPHAGNYALTSQMYLEPVMNQYAHGELTKERYFDSKEYFIFSLKGTLFCEWP